MEGLQVGNECLKKMHQVGPHGPGVGGSSHRAQKPRGFVLDWNLSLDALEDCQCLAGT